MNRKAVSAIMLTLFLISMLTPAFNVAVTVADSNIVKVSDRNYLKIQETDKNNQPVKDGMSGYSMHFDNFSDQDVLEPNFVPGEIIVKFKSSIYMEWTSGSVVSGIESIDACIPLKFLAF